MKDLRPFWFLKPPVDAEHKRYILMDFLKSIHSEIKNKKIYSSLRKISILREELNYFYRHNMISDHRIYLPMEEEKLIYSFHGGFFSPEETREIEKIVTDSILLLNRYLDFGESLCKDLEGKIKIFNLEVPDPRMDLGIIIFRNMVNDEIFSYWWKKTEMKFGNETKEGIILKKISLLNNKYTMPYEFIVHEVLSSMGIRNGSKISCTVIEISEDFDTRSEIFEIAKEKFLKEIKTKD